MAESSILWSTSGVGDGTNSGYTQAQMHEMFRALFAGIHATNLGGVAPDYLNELAVTGTATPVAVNTGAAVVYGLFYSNSASVNVAVATPSVSTRIDYIVLRANYTAQTVRITKIDGAEGGAAPALTQSAGVTWDIPLATVSITTGGVITVTDAREWASLLGDGMVITAKLANDAVTTAKIATSQITNALMADDAIDSAEIADGAIDTIHIAAAQVTQAKLGTDTLQMLVIPLYYYPAALLTQDAAYAEMSATNGYVRLTLDKDKLPTTCTVKLVATMQVNNASVTGYCQLYNVTDVGAVTGSEVTTASAATPAVVTSGDVYANLGAGSKVYTIQRKISNASYGVYLTGAFLLVEW